MKTFTAIKIFFCFLFAVSLTGCLSNQYLERKQYLFHVAFPAQQKYITHKTMAINPFTVTATSSSSDFIYRRSEGEWVADYYNGFATVPDQQLTEIFTAYLKRIIPVSENNMTDVNYLFEPQLLELYADYRDQSHPTAVMKIRWVLRKEKDATPDKIILDKTFSQTVPLSEKTSGSLMVAWNQALQNILQQTAAVLKTSLSKTHHS